MRSVFGVMILFLGFAFCSALGQSIQVDPSEINGGNSAKDSKLVAVPALASGDQQQFDQAMKDIHFDFDKSDLRPDEQAALANNADWLKAHPEIMITLEGDADERGSVVYNLVLSAERANTVRDALLDMGVPADRIAFATGWGKSYPVCTQSEESCWSQNRRTHFATWPPEETEASTSQVAIALEP